MKKIMDKWQVILAPVKGLSIVILVIAVMCVDERLLLRRDSYAELAFPIAFHRLAPLNGKFCEESTNPSQQKKKKLSIETSWDEILVIAIKTVTLKLSTQVSRKKATILPLICLLSFFIFIMKPHWYIAETIKYKWLFVQSWIYPDKFYVCTFQVLQFLRCIIKDFNSRLSLEATMIPTDWIWS